MSEKVETNEQIIKRLEKTLDTFGEIYYMDREYWTGGQIRDTQDAEDDFLWLIERAKKADLLEKELQTIEKSTLENPHTRMQLYILEKGYTYSVSDILKSYLDYDQKGYYVSQNMKDCIADLEDEIKELLKE